MSNLRFVPSLILGISVCIKSQSLFADTLQPFRSSYTQDCAGTSFCQFSDILSSAIGAPVSLNKTYATPTLQTTAVTYAESSARTLRTSATVSFQIFGSPQYAYASANAGFEDILTVNYAPFTGQTGWMFVNYQLSGIISTVAPAGAYQLFGIGVGVNQAFLEQSYDTSYSSSVGGIFWAPMRFQFTYGQPFAFEVGMTSVAGTQDVNRGLLMLTGNGSGSAQFRDTAEIMGFSITDGSGTFIPGVQIQSALGQTYAITPVPEPSTWCFTFTGFGICLLAGLRRIVGRGVYCQLSSNPHLAIFIERSHIRPPVV